MTGVSGSGPDLLPQLEAAGALPIPGPDRNPFHPATHVLYEWQTYWLRLPGVDTLRIGDEPLLPAAFDLFALRYENRLGLSTIMAEVGGGPAGPAVTVEVLSPKFPDLASHTRFLTGILNDLHARAARLPFCLSSGTARGVRPAAASPGPIFLYHFLGHYAGEIHRALAKVTARPHRDLRSVDLNVPLMEASDLDAGTLLGILEHCEEWAPAANLAVSDQLGGAAPTVVRQSCSDETMDTPPNRFVRSFLLDLTRAVEALPLQPWWPAAPLQRRREITRLGNFVRRQLRLPLFAEVGEMFGLPGPAAAHREGYRELSILWGLFHGARRPLFGRLEQAIAVRDIAALYEAWVFFWLVEAISAAGGCGAAGDLEVRLSEAGGVAWQAEVSFPGCRKLIYNQAYLFEDREYGSYSVPLRPDFTWVVDGKPAVVLDAKFRLDRPPDGGANVRHDDLHKAHAYRDALGVRAAVVLYPGEQSVFYGRDRERGTRLPHGTDLLEILSGSPEGVGVLALRP